MKIDDLIIENFRGISRIEARSLGDTIIISGQNGSGKSCIFDAIRLLKSTYGGYQQNEWQHFFGEFQIQLHGTKNLDRLFNEQGRPLRISAKFRLREAERSYISSNLPELVEETIWQVLLPEAFQFGGYRKALFANQFRDSQQEVKKRLDAELPIVNAQLSAPHIDAEIVVTPSGEVRTNPSRLLEVIFSNYRPQEIGVIDFHGAQRHYGRENVQGINLNLETEQQARSQHSLYNYNNKYHNVKTEMAANFIKQLLVEKANANEPQAHRDIVVTLKELFQSFFPDKEFLGPQPTPDGVLTFPVKTKSGTLHDLDELSSGEKEILYGYLRIRSSAPRNSIILLDEPELHLNPRLIRGLPEFYRKHLGEELANQLWLVTHSDALIREAVGKPGFNVFHMVPCSADGIRTGQLTPLTVTKEFDGALADLVGDLAAYRPGGKGVIFEGGGDSEFDKRVVGTLFSDELSGVNLISGANKARVRALHEILSHAYENGDLPTKFYAIVDKDSDDDVDEGGAISRFKWDVYHIENYLLDPDLIAGVLSALGVLPLQTPSHVMHQLERCARSVLPILVQHRLRSFANAPVIQAIDLSFSPRAPSVSAELYSALQRSRDRINRIVDNDLSREKLSAKEAAINEELSRVFVDGSWIKVLPGREILRFRTH